MSQLKRLLIASMAVMAMTACGGGDSEGDAEAAFDPKLSAIQENLCTPGCTNGPCHNATDKTGGLDLSSTSASFANLVGVDSEKSTLKRVVANDVDNSFLIYRSLNGLHSLKQDACSYVALQ